MPFRDDHIVCIQLGSHTTRAIHGLAESLTPPTARIPSLVWRDQSTEQYICGSDVSIYPGERSNLVAVNPIVGGNVNDWAALTVFLNHVIYTVTGEEAGLTISDCPVVLIVPPQWSMSDREKVTKIFLEQFLRPAFMIIDSAIASLYACNTMTGLVVDIGYEKTDVTPIIDSSIVTTATKTVALGGHDMTRHLLELLQTEPPLDQATQTPINAATIDIDLAETIKCSNICEILPDSLGGQANAAFQDAPKDESAEGVLDIAAVVASGRTREYLARVEAEKAGKSTQEIIPNAQLTHNTISVEGRGTIVVGQARFRACELSSMSASLLSDAIFEAICHPAVELGRRKDLWNNIVLVGGGSKGKYFREMLLGMLQAKFATPLAAPLSDPYSGLAYTHTYPSAIQMLRIPIHFPEWNMKDGDDRVKGSLDEGTFLGAQIMAHIAFSSTETGAARLYITRNDYIATGPPGVHL